MLLLRWKSVNIYDDTVCGVTLTGAALVLRAAMMTAFILATVSVIALDLGTRFLGLSPPSVPSTRRGELHAWLENTGAVLSTPSAAGKWTALSNSCGLTDEGEVHCWGDGKQMDESPNEMLVQFHGSQMDGFCGVTSMGKVVCWDVKEHLLQGSFQPSVPPDTNWLWTESSFSLHCGITSSHDLHCWSFYGKFYMDGAPQGVKWKQITVPTTGVCGISVEGRLHCWGVCLYGFCDHPRSEGVVWIDVSCEEYSCCAISEEGELRCWGTSAPRNVPSEIRWSSISVEYQAVCGVVKGTGEGQCFGPAGRFELPTHPYKWRSIRADTPRGTQPSGSSSTVCGATESHGVKCVGANFQNEWKEADGDWYPANGGGSWCYVSSTGEGLCHHRYWRKLQNVLIGGTRAREAGWRSLDMSTAAIACGVRTTGELVCWSIQSLPSDVELNSHLNMRFAHMSGLSVSTAGVCGYQLLADRHRCFGFQGRFPYSQPLADEAATLFGSGILWTKPTPEAVVAVGGTVRVQINFGSYATTVMTGTSLLAAAGVRVVWVASAIDGTSTYVSISLQDGVFPSGGILSLSGPFEKLAVSAQSLCIINSQSLIECHAPFTALASAIQGQAKDVAMSDSRACALVLNGTLFCLDVSNGAGGEVVHTWLQEVHPLGYLTVSTAENTTCAIAADYTMHCFGPPARVSILAGKLCCPKGWCRQERNARPEICRHVP